MSGPIILLDACVLYPAQLRSLMMYLAAEGLFRPRWSAAINEGWMRNLLRDKPDLTIAQVERVRDLMTAHIPNCLVTGYEHLIPTLSLPDPNDRHVLAAALLCGAVSLVTFNLDHFPSATLSSLGVEAIHPDQIVLRSLRERPADVCAAVQRQRLSLKNPPKSVDEFLGILDAAVLTATAAALRPFADSL